MHIDDVSPLLRCPQCNKPFDKVSTLKRHGYYCRSKKSKSTATRIRSCVICAKTKQRCDQRKPECSRCAFKNLNCSYPADRPQPGQSDKDSETSSDLEAFFREPSASASSPDSISIADVTSQYDNVLVDRSENSHHSSAAIEIDLLDLELFENDPVFPEIFINHSNKDISLDLPSSWMVPTYLDIPSTPSSLIRQMGRRPAATVSLQRAASLMLSTLKSYPLMIINHNKSPPFIHYSSLHPDSESDASESLANCLSIMQMLKEENRFEIESRSRALTRPNQRLFWKNVRWECERFCNEAAKLSSQELLSALQALSIYLLVRLSEGETDHNNYDHLLIKTVTILSQQFTSVTSTPSEKSWKGFIFMESVRRLCLIYQIVNLLVYFEPAALCELPTNLVLAPLPSRKELWSTSSEHSFNEALRQNSNDRDRETLMFGMTAVGGLIKMTASSTGTSPAIYGAFTESNKVQMKDAAWEEYCEGMDELGTLVLLSSSLLG